jgi:hypothetical protein
MAPQPLVGLFCDIDTGEAGMNITLPKDDTIKADLAAIGRQAPFALSLGINNTGLAAQTAVRQAIRTNFAIRGTGAFFDRGVVFQRGTKAKPEAALFIGVEGGWPRMATKRASAILARHEQGGQRESTAVVKAGNQLVPGGFFLPGPGLRSRGANPPRSIYPSAIGATLRRQVSGEQRYAKDVKGRGAKRAAYYVIPRVGIFERKSGGLGTRSRPIWFLSRTVRTAPRTDFESTAQRTVDDVWSLKVSAAIGQAMETAR